LIDGATLPPLPYDRGNSPSHVPHSVDIAGAMAFMLSVCQADTAGRSIAFFAAHFQVDATDREAIAILPKGNPRSGAHETANGA
jgi:hypothetical protein